MYFENIINFFNRKFFAKVFSIAKDGSFLTAEEVKANPTKEQFENYFGLDLVDIDRIIQRDDISSITNKQPSKEKLMHVFKFLEAIVFAAKNFGLNIYDFDRKDQYGITTDGRIVILDYGFTNEVNEKYYKAGNVDPNRQIPNLALA